MGFRFRNYDVTSYLPRIRWSWRLMPTNQPIVTTMKKELIWRVLLVDVIIATLSYAGHQHAKSFWNPLTLEIWKNNLKLLLLKFNLTRFGKNYHCGQPHVRGKYKMRRPTCFLMQTSTGWASETVTGLNTGVRVGSNVHLMRIWSSSTSSCNNAPMDIGQRTTSASA